MCRKKREQNALTQYALFGYSVKERKKADKRTPDHATHPPISPVTYIFFIYLFSARISLSKKRKGAINAHDF